MEEEKTRRLLGKDENGKVGFKMITEKVWRCPSQMEDVSSLPRSFLSSGGNNRGRKVTQNGDRHVDRKLNSAQLQDRRRCEDG